MVQTDRDIDVAQRIAVLEFKVTQLTTSNEEVCKKLDDLLQLRSKGMGAFWLASSLLGTGIIGIVFALISWMRSSTGV